MDNANNTVPSFLCFKYTEQADANDAYVCPDGKL